MEGIYSLFSSARPTGPSAIAHANGEANSGRTELGWIRFLRIVRQVSVPTGELVGDCRTRLRRIGSTSEALIIKYYPYTRQVCRIKKQQELRSMEASIAKYRSTTGRYLESDYAVVSTHTPVKMVLAAPSPMD